MKNIFLLLFSFTSFFIFTEICLSLEIPTIIFSFQQPSYLVDKNQNFTTFNCVKGEECKVNFNLEDSFISGFPKTKYACEIDFGMGAITGEENKCNPNTVIFGTGQFNVNFKILEKSSPTNFKNKIIQINNLEEISSSGSSDSGNDTNENSGSTNTGATEDNGDLINSGQTNPVESNTITGSFLSTGSIINISNSGAFLTGVTFTGGENVNVFYGSGIYNLSGALLDSGFEFINLQENTDYIYELYLVNNSGGILDFFTGSFKTNSGIIIYGTGEEANSGIFESGSTQNTGGLLFIPDIVLDFQIPNYLIVRSGSIDEYDCDDSKDECKANFNLEKSFSGAYKESNYLCEIFFGSGFITGEENKCNPNTVVFGTGNFDIIFKIFDKNNLSNFNEKQIKIYNNPILENLIVPDPIITIQSGLDSNYSCLKSDCIINLTAENSFQNISNTKFSCLWNFGSGSFSSGSQASCNPSYIHYGIGIFDINLKIYEKGNEVNFKETKITIKNDNYFFGSGPSTSTYKSTDEIYYPAIAKILLQGKINGETRKVEGNTITCFEKEKCSINFIAEKNLGKVNYFWNFGNGTTSESMNPKSVIYGLGDYEVILKVTDNIGFENTDHFFVKVLKKEDKEKLKTEKIVVEKIKKVKVKGVKEESEDVQKLFSNNLSSFNFEIYVQGKISKDKKIVGNTIYCNTKKTCSINFGIKGAKNNKELNYLWDFGNGQTSILFNPKTTSYSFGKFTTTLNISDSGSNILTTKNYFVVINKILTKIKSAKKVKVKKAKTEKEKKILIKGEDKNFKNNIKINKQLSTEDVVLSGIGVSILSLLGAYFLIKKYSNLF